MDLKLQRIKEIVDSFVDKYNKLFLKLFKLCSIEY